MALLRRRRPREVAREDGRGRRLDGARVVRAEPDRERPPRVARAGARGHGRDVVDEAVGPEREERARRGRDDVDVV